jgi:3-phosphoshikimate 1-carboxyvinyltransferase
MEQAVIHRSSALRGEAGVPGDKSISHRALILSSQARGKTEIRGLSRGEDVRDTARALRALGVEMSPWGSDPLVVDGAGAGGWKEPEDVLDFGNSGTGIRLMAGMVAAHPFFSALSGDRYLRRRPMKRIVEPLKLMGASIAGRRGGEYPPLAVQGAPLRGISYTSPVASAQVKSSILLAGLLGEGTTAVTEPALSRDHTERMLEYLGVEVERRDLTVLLRGGQEWEARDLEVPADPSAAAFPLAAALVVPDSEVTVRNVCVNPTRTGLFDIIAEMGGELAFSSRRESCGEPVADITARFSTLKGVDVHPSLVPRAIDEFPILSVLALFAAGDTVISGAGELRVKESDRISTMAEELRRLGAEVEERADGLVVAGRRPLGTATCSSHGDHRVAMALAVAGCTIGGGLLIEDTACVRTSFPGFWDMLKSLGGEMASSP